MDPIEIPFFLENTIEIKEIIEYFRSGTIPQYVLRTKEMHDSPWRATKFQAAINLKVSWSFQESRHQF